MTRRRTLPSHRAMVRRILRHYRAASVDDLAAGLDWYDATLATAEALAAATGGAVTVRRAAGVIAALSPRMQWSTNVRAAAAVIDAYHRGAPPPRVGLRRNVMQAGLILSGHLDGPTGPKTSTFMRAILGDRMAVTVDVWAARAAGLPMPEGKGVTAAQYRRIAAAYTDAAAILGRAPRDVQAAVWIVVRGAAR